MSHPRRPESSFGWLDLAYIGETHKKALCTNFSDENCVLCSWDRASPFCVNKCPIRCNYTQFILSVNCSTCFGWFLHPSWAHITVSTASGSSQPLLIPVAIVEELRLQSSSMIATVSNSGWLLPDAVDTVICAPDHGWRNHPKHVEQCTDKINCV